MVGEFVKNREGKELFGDDGIKRKRCGKNPKRTLS